jgi:hypothetical protein
MAYFSKQLLFTRAESSYLENELILCTNIANLAIAALKKNNSATPPSSCISLKIFPSIIIESDCYIHECMRLN